MKLFCELTEEVRYLTEEKEGGKKDYFIEGIFLQSAIKNRNGRIYPESIMDKEVGRYLGECVDKHRAYGELGHPQGPQINLDRVSHRIVSLVKEGTNYIGKAKVSSTPNGLIARAIIEDGGVLGVSSRAIGSLKPNNGIMEVQDDFRLATAADIVSDPSAPDAFVRGIMENVEYWWDIGRGTWIEQKMGDLQSTIKTLSKSELDERKVAMFESFVSKISKI